MSAILALCACGGGSSDGSASSSNTSSTSSSTSSGAGGAVTSAATVTVNLAGGGVGVTDQILGMNMANWFDVANPGVAAALQGAGVKAVRWPGGSISDTFHWQTNQDCGGGYVSPSSSFQDFLTDVAGAADVDVAVTVNYGSNAACSGGGDPTEAAAWVSNALANGNKVSHWTVGNEVYGSWEYDLHAAPHDPTTYANAVATGYYPAMKAANPNTLVGVVVAPGYDWDTIVLSQAPYDFVELHFYAQSPGQESDTYLVGSAAQALTAKINAVKTDLESAGHPDTPIYVGELGSVASQPGKQSTSITQALFAGQVLGELMNAGVARATWWLAFGGCADPSVGNFSASLYGWQDFGGYMLFSDGLPEYGCSSASPLALGTPLPTSRVFEMWSAVARNGETVLTTAVSGDTTDIRAYAATHGSATALVLFNVNATTSQTVTVAPSSLTGASDVTVQTYDKAIYDQSKTGVWAPPVTTDLGAKSLPLQLTLTPWSMNVVVLTP